MKINNSLFRNKMFIIDERRKANMLMVALNEK